MKTSAKWRSRSTRSSLRHWWEWLFIFTFQPLYPWGKTLWYPLETRFGGPHRRPGGRGEDKNHWQCLKLNLGYSNDKCTDIHEVGYKKLLSNRSNAKKKMKIRGMKKDERTVHDTGRRNTLDCGCCLLLTGLNTSYIIVSKWVLHVYCSPKANPWPTSSVPLLFGNKCYWKKAPGLCKAFPSTTSCISLIQTK